MGFRSVHLGVALVAAASFTSAWAAPGAGDTTASARTSAVWTPKQVEFPYRAFTAKYTCDGLRDRMHRILQQLGARSDAEVRISGCMRSPAPERVPISVRVKMNVLEPAAGESRDAVSAHWKTVDLQTGVDPLEIAGDCELIQQVRDHVLPLFATRNVVANTTCVPRASIIGSTQLKAEVLVADSGAKSVAR